LSHVLVQHAGNVLHTHAAYTLQLSPIGPPSVHGLWGQDVSARRSSEGERSRTRRSPRGASRRAPSPRSRRAPSPWSRRAPSPWQRDALPRAALEHLDAAAQRRDRKHGHEPATRHPVAPVPRSSVGQWSRRNDELKIRQFKLRLLSPPKVSAARRAARRLLKQPLSRDWLRSRLDAAGKRQRDTVPGLTFGGGQGAIMRSLLFAFSSVLFVSGCGSSANPSPPGTKLAWEPCCATYTPTGDGSPDCGQGTCVAGLECYAMPWADASPRVGYCTETCSASKSCSSGAACSGDTGFCQIQCDSNLCTGGKDRCTKGELCPPLLTCRTVHSSSYYCQPL
jgi:hypothetical protein